MDASNTKCSARIKLLIKNMFDNKNSGWQKSKEENKEIKKKAEIEQQVTKQADEKAKELQQEERDQYNDGGRGYKGGKDNLSQSQYVGSGKGGKYNNDQPSLIKKDSRSYP